MQWVHIPTVRLAWIALGTLVLNAYFTYGIWFLQNKLGDKKTDTESENAKPEFGLLGQGLQNAMPKKSEPTASPKDDKATAYKKDILKTMENSKEAVDKAKKKILDATKKVISKTKDSVQETIPIVKKTASETIKNVKNAVDEAVIEEVKPAVQKVTLNLVKGGWWFTKKKSSFWKTLVKWTPNFKPKTERLKLYLEKTFSTNNFDDLCPSRISELSAELEEMSNEFVKEIPEKCMTAGLLEKAEGLGVVKKLSLRKIFEGVLPEMSSADKLQIISQDLEMFSGSEEIISGLTGEEAFSICERVNTKNLPLAMTYGKTFSEKLSGRLKKCVHQDVISVKGCAAFLTTALSPCVEKMTCAQTKDFGEAKLPHGLAKLVTKACTQNIDGEKVKDMPCAAITQLRLRDIMSVSAKSWVSALSKLTKCYSERGASEETQKAGGEEEKPSEKKKKKKKSLVQKMKTAARIPRRTKKKPAKLSRTELIKMIQLKDLDKEALFNILESNLAWAITPQKFREVDAETLCNPDKNNTDYSKLRDNARKAVTEKCAEIFAEGPLSARGLTIVDMSEEELKAELKEITDPEQLVATVADACVYAFRLRPGLLEVLAGQVKDLNLTEGQRMEDVACVLPMLEVDLLNTFCDGYSDRLKLALGRPEVDLSKRPKNKGRLLGLCENDTVAVTPCEQGDLVSQYSESAADTLTCDIIKADMPCMGKVRSIAARKKIVKKCLDDQDNVEQGCVTPEFMNSLGNLMDEMEAESLNSECNKKLLPDAGPAYFKDRAEMKWNCDSWRESGSAELEDEEDVCNRVDNVTVSRLVLMEMVRKEAEISEKEAQIDEEEAPSIGTSRKKRRINLGAIVSGIFDRLQIPCSIILQLNGDLSAIAPEQMLAMSAKEFQSCTEPLGTYEHYDKDMLIALARKVKEVHGDTGYWESDVILPAFVAGLEDQDLSGLDLRSLDVLETLGRSAYFESANKSRQLLSAWREDTGVSASEMMAEQVVALGAGLCSLALEDLRAINQTALEEAVETLGSLVCMSYEAIELLYQRVIQVWDLDVLNSEHVTSLGNLIAGANFTTLGLEVIRDISIDEEVIVQIPAEKWQTVSDEQLRALTQEQAHILQTNVLEHFTNSRKAIILEKAGEEVPDEIPEDDVDLFPEDAITDGPLVPDGLADGDVDSQPPVAGEEDEELDVHRDEVKVEVDLKPLVPSEEDKKSHVPVEEDMEPHVPGDESPYKGEVDPKPPVHDGENMESHVPSDEDPDQGHRDQRPPDGGEGGVELPVVEGSEKNEDDPKPPVHDGEDMESHVPSHEDPDQGHRDQRPPDGGEGGVELPDVEGSEKNEDDPKPPVHDGEGMESHDPRDIDPEKSDGGPRPPVRGEGGLELPIPVDQRPGEGNGQVKPPARGDEEPYTGEEHGKKPGPADRDMEYRPLEDELDTNEVMDDAVDGNEVRDDAEDRNEVRDDAVDGNGRHSIVSKIIRQLGDLTKLRKEQIKKLKGEELPPNVMAKFPEEIYTEMVDQLGEQSKTPKQMAVLQSKLREKVPSTKTEVSKFMKWMSFRKLKKVKDDIVRDMRPHMSTMDPRQAFKTGRRIIKSVVDSFPNLPPGEKHSKAEELMGTELVNEASKKDRTQILNQVGKMSTDTLKKVGFNKLKRLSADYGKEIIKKMKQSNEWSCKGNKLKELSEATPKRMSMFLPATCVEEADEASVVEVVKRLGEAAVPQENEEPRSLRKMLLSPAVSVFTSRMMKKAKKISKENFKPILDSMMVKLVSVRNLGDMPEAAVCREDVSYDYTLLAQRLLLLEKCDGSLGNLSGSKVASYGALASALTPADIEVIDAGDDDILSKAQTLCQHERDLIQEQETALYRKIRPRLIKNAYAALKDEGTLEKLKCVLKYLDDSILDNLEIGDFEKVCEYIGKCELAKMKPGTVEKLKTLCLQTKISYKKMGGLLRAMKASDLKDQEEQIWESIEELSIEVLSPEARQALYSTVCDNKTGEMDSKLGATEMALCGRLFGEFGDLSTMDEEVVIDLVEPISRECEAGRKKMRECVKSGQPKADCRQNHRGCQELMAHIFRTLSKTQTSRRKRSERARRRADETCSSNLTCDDIKLAGTEAVLIDPEQLKALCKSHFDDCASTLGSLSDYTAEQRQALLETAIKHWGEPKTWTADQVEKAGVIVLAMTRSQLEMISITSLETAHSIGQHYEWNTQSEKLTSVFENWLRTNKQNNASTITAVDLQSIGHIACGADTGAIDQIDAEVYMDAAQAIGRLDTCGIHQLRGWAGKAIQFLGPVTEWSRAEVATVGSVIGGLSKAEIQLLTTAQIQAIPYYTIPNIPAMCFSKFTEAQLKQFHSLQAVHITEEQIKSLSDAQRAIVTVKAEVIRDQASIQGPEPDGGGAFICMSLWVLLTGLLAFFLQI